MRHTRSRDPFDFSLQVKQGITETQFTCVEFSMSVVPTCMGAIVRFLITNKQLNSKFVLNNSSVFYLSLFFRVNDVNLKLWLEL